MEGNALRALVLVLAVAAISTAATAQISPIDQIQMELGSGDFLTEGGPGRREKTITVFYHQPASFTAQSRVLMVVPGAGRNGWSYRDAWVETSEEYGVLILSPHYSEQSYPEFWSYNLAGMITDVDIDRRSTPEVTFTVNRDPNEWIFGDFDRIFREVKEDLELETATYDMFGHSAGGQIVHRLALFHPSNMADRMLAANSGWYTVPIFRDEFPYGLANSTATKEQIEKAFRRDLVILLGNRDDKNETRGDLRRTPEVDVQGISRIERGKYFYKVALETAESLNTELNWKLEVVPGVGHDFRRMSEAAAAYLY